jgi:hypothetical protein
MLGPDVVVLHAPRFVAGEKQHFSHSFGKSIVHLRPLSSN